MSVKVELTTGDYAVASTLAMMRQTVNRASGVKVSQVDKRQSGADVDLIGMLGEIAVCKHFNVMPDLSIEPRKGGSDCIIKGMTVDVKSTHHKHGQLLGESTKASHPEDLYILCIVDGTTVTIAGAAWGNELFDESRLTTMREGYKPTYAIPQNELRPVPEKPKL